MDQDENPGLPVNSGPFGLGVSTIVIDRALRIANSIFPQTEADVTLVHEGLVWRSRDATDPHGTSRDPADLVLATQEPLWAQDATHLYVGVPIRLSCGSLLGVLSVRGAIGQAADPSKTARLQDLADFVADEWTRTRTARELAGALERREQSEGRLNLALALADIHVWELDYVRRELVKAGAEDTFFTTPKTYEDLYRDVYVTVDPRDRPRVEAAWARHLETGEPFRPDYRIVRDDDREVWVQCALEFFVDAKGRPQRLVGAIQNITERKAAERSLRAKDEAEAASQAKAELLASMSHELRTPLNAVLGFAEVLRLNRVREPLTLRQEEAVGHILENGRHLVTLIEAMFDLARLDNGKAPVCVESLDLAEALADARDSFAVPAEQAGLTLACESAACPAVAADRTRLRQILHSLVSNAIKYNRPGGEVRLTTRKVGDQVEIAVRDTGLGIAQAKLDEVFQPFNRLGREGGAILGAGIGLAVGKRLAESMGGELRVASIEGEGSTFTLVLPAALAGAATTVDDDVMLRVAARR